MGLIGVLYYKSGYEFYKENIKILPPIVVAQYKKRSVWKKNNNDRNLLKNFGAPLPRASLKLRKVKAPRLKPCFIVIN